MYVNNTRSSATTAYSTINSPTDSNQSNIYNGPLDGFSNDSVSLCTSGKPDNLSRGLSGMGQAVYLRGNNKKMETGGCGPCIGLAITYQSVNGDKSGLLAHLQPESELDEFIKNIRFIFDDQFEAKMNITLTTVLDENKEVADKQERRLQDIQDGINQQFDFLYIDNDNITVSTIHSALSVDIDSMSAELKQYTDEKFNATDIDYMNAHMVNDSHSLHYFS
ncbi:hypothetical protein PJ612_004236 [Salmonella enterica]|nr:hypothetical protein [Salmonella enterica]